MRLQRQWFQKSKLLVFGLVSLLSGCWACEHAKKERIVTPAFYYWKTDFSLSRKEQKILSDNKIAVLYAKFFDVDWDARTKKPVAKALITSKSPLPKEIRVIPVVYITNRTLLQLNKAQVVKLAERIVDKVQGLSNAVWGASSRELPEVQIDCDWTNKTRRNYFLLLTTLKQKIPALSATIRLHQIKYRSITGVPPVDRGMLMSYNMSDWQELNRLNSIYEPATLDKYIDELEDYPLALDLVMPAFHWGIVYRNNRFLYFINNLTEKVLLSKKLPLNLQTAHQFVLQQDTVALGLALRKGDVIKVEEVPFDNLLKGSSLLCKKISNQKLTFALYHLDESSLSSYSYEQISQLFQNVK